MKPKQSQQLASLNEQKMNTAIEQIEAKQTPVLCITIACTDARWVFAGWTCAVPKLREQAARPEPIEAAEKPSPAKNAYLIAPNFSKFLGPSDFHEIGEIAKDEVCSGCWKALRERNGQWGEAKFVGRDDLYCFGLCEQAVQ